MPHRCTVTYFPNLRQAFILGGGLPNQDLCPSLRQVLQVNFSESIKDWQGKSVEAHLLPKELKHARYCHATSPIEIDEKQYLLVTGSSLPDAEDKAELFSLATNNSIILPKLSRPRQRHSQVILEPQTVYCFNHDSIEFLKVNLKWKFDAQAQKLWTPVQLRVPPLPVEPTLLPVAGDRIVIAGGEMMPEVLNYTMFVVNTEESPKITKTGPCFDPFVWNYNLPHI